MMTILKVTGLAMLALSLMGGGLCAEDQKTPEGWKRVDLPKWDASFAVPAKWIEDKIDLGKMGLAISASMPDEDDEAFFPEFGLNAGVNMIPIPLDKVADAHVRIAKAGTEDFKVVKREKIKFLGRDTISMTYDSKMHGIWLRTVELVIEIEKDKEVLLATYMTLRDDHANEEELIEQCLSTVIIK